MTVGMKFTTTVMVWPTGRDAVLQVIKPPAAPGAGRVQIPPALALAEVNCRLLARVVAKTTPLAPWLLPFLICQVYVSDVPCVGPPFCAAPVTWISVMLDGRFTVVVKEAELFAGVGSVRTLPAVSSAAAEA